ncbi:non-homologous end-joining DNA ligase [Luethyella okanaganae]|uniref:Non-homologous end-joining DNA ligase n=1 Tax=Luethyella okanaganae TaxID=69372 RepID=A0ABW1VGT8_9MICO
MATTAQSQTITVDGRDVVITHPFKVLYPETGTTKADVVGYLTRIAPILLPHLHDRAVTRKRWIDGTGTAENPRESFFQRNLDDTTPEWIVRRTVQHKERTVDYAIANDASTLLWFAQTASLELHVPQWRFGPRGAHRSPDRLVIDLDPGPGTDLPECVEVALLVRDLLLERDLEALPVTSGGKGVHLYAPLNGSLGSDQATEIASDVADQLVSSRPALAVANMRKVNRDGKVLVDWSQNRAAKTTVSPYSLRGRTRPTVAAPRTWAELEAPGLGQMEFPEVLARVERSGDLLKPLLSQPIPSSKADAPQ